MFNASVLYFGYFILYLDLQGSTFLQRAINEGADFIETDILASKDGALICFHDVTLDDTTDVAQHKEFSDRKRTYEVQGDNMTGFFPGIYTLSFVSY